MNDRECTDFLQWALPRLEMRWAGFRRVRGQVCKRIARRINELGLSGISAYREHLVREPAEWAALGSLCRVTISRFFRDRGVFELLRRRVLPELAERAAGTRATTAGVRAAAPSPAVGTAAPPVEAVVRCWSAGCASGEEPYALSVLWLLHLRPRFPGVRFEVLATDADAALLERARAGRYPTSALRELPPPLIEGAFGRAGGEFRLRPLFRSPVELRCQDIRHAMPDGPFDLILCRNLVFTYFELALQSRLLDRVLQRLADGGFLVLGSHEELPAGEWPLERISAGAPVFRAVPW